MKNKLILLFSHDLTENQKYDTINTLGIYEFIKMPQNLQHKWSNVPNDLTSIINYLNDIKIWIKGISNKEDYILIQGDFGATYHMVNWAYKNSLNPVYSTTKRFHIENNIGKNKIEIKKTFQHTIFRVYQ